MSQYDQLRGDLKRKRNIFLRILFWINILCALVLAFSLLATSFSPQDFWPLAFLGLAWYYLILINTGFILLWLFLWRRMILVSLLPILFSFGNFKHLVRFNSSAETKQEGSMKILSYNVRLFDLYNWSHNKETRGKIFNFLKNENADIMCLQEFYDNDTHFPVLDTFLSFQDTKNFHVEYTLDLKGQHFGIATFSKYPIVNKGFIDFNEESNNSCIYTDIYYEKDTIRIYNLHLQSNRLNVDDLAFLENLGSENNVDEIKSSEKIFSKLKNGFIKRAGQAELVAHHVMKCPYPKVVCGDFNDSPFSYTYSMVRQDMKDAFEECGSGFGRTYNGKFPSFRIDYILFGKEFEAQSFQTMPVGFSDHYPIMAELKLQK